MIYLDHAATTPIFSEVLEAMLPWFQPERVGNPGSIHTQGSNAHKAIEQARAQVARMIGADPAEIFFTSGGTESNNTWLQCAKDTVVRRPIILTTKIEHHSVTEPIERSAYHRAEYIKVNCDGSVNLENLERLLQLHGEEVGGVSVMWVNNELGTVNPIKEIGTLCKSTMYCFTPTQYKPQAISLWMFIIVVLIFFLSPAISLVLRWELVCCILTVLSISAL